MSSQTLTDVQVPDTRNSLSHESYLRLQRNIDPLSSASGKDLYCSILYDLCF